MNEPRPEMQSTFDQRSEPRAVAPPEGPALRGKFELGTVLGRGGMGQVHEARDRGLRRQVAVKSMLRPDDPDARERFLFEAEVTGQLAHPNIVPIYELAADADGHPYLAMKRVDGSSLASLLDQSRRTRTPLRTRRRLLEIFHKVCDAVAFAHSRGVIHRDLKPDNVMVGEFGEVLVMDWGLARQIDADERHRPVQTHRDTSSDGSSTIYGAVIGTPMYMPPEQARGELDRLDARSDIYSLGAMLYEMLGLIVPYEYGPPHQVLAAVIDGPPPPLRERGIAPWPIPPELSAIVARAMDPEPDRRYASVSDLVDDLRAWADHRAVTVWQDGPLRRLVKWTRRHPTLAVGSGVTLLMLALTSAAGNALWRLTAEARRQAAEQKAERERVERSARDAALLADARAGDFERVIERLGGQARRKRDAAVQEFARYWAANSSKLSEARMLAELGPTRLDSYLAAFDRLFAAHEELGDRFPLEPSDYFFRGMLRSLHRNQQKLAIADYTRCLALDPTFVDALQNRGTSHQRLGNVDAALLDFEAALELDPSRAMLHYNISVCLHQKRDRAGALRHATRAIALNDQLATAYLMRGKIQHAAEPAAALADYRAALQRDDSLAEAHNNLGLLIEPRDVPGARAAYEAAIRLQPDLEQPYLNLASLHARAGALRRARAVIDRLIRERPDSVKGRFQRGQLSLKLGDRKQAYDDFLGAAKRSKTQAGPHYMTALLLLENKRHAQAIPHLDRALKLAPRYAEAYVNRSICHRETGNTDDAFADANRAVRIKPTLWQAWSARAAAHLAAGRRELAAKDFEAAAKRAPEARRTHLLRQRDAARKK